MLILLLKLTLAPALVAAATQVATRLGPRAGGLVGGLPVVAGPILLIYALEQGHLFARHAAAAAVLGIASLAAFCASYGAVARRHGVVPALAAGWLAFAVATAMLSRVSPPLALSTAFTLVCLAGTVALLRALAPAGAPGRAGPSLLVWRLAVTAGLVLALTAAAHHLPAHLAGLLAPFPIITAVLAGFTHAANGGAAAIDLLAGLASALGSFTAFFVTLAALIGGLGLTAFLLSTVAALLVWACSLPRPLVM